MLGGHLPVHPIRPAGAGHHENARSHDGDSGPHVVALAGLAWGTALARPPFVSTLSLWESGHAAAAYAYGTSGGGHSRAIAADRSHPFHRLSAFIRFRPVEAHGSLGGRNPLPEGVVAGRHQ